MKNIIKNIVNIKYYLFKFYFIGLFFYLIISETNCLADWQHYNSFLIGERAAGMGGAYTALSNDPSGIFYNPGGIAFANDTELSLSTVGYFIEEFNLNSLFGISSYKYQAKNSDIINGFFGFTNKIKLFNDEYYFGFGVYIPDHTRGCPT